jgi:hypothetical protein
VDLDKLARRCRTLGVEILDNGKVHFAQSAPPSRRNRKSEAPPPSSSAGKTAARSGVRSRSAPARRRKTTG